jgi:hypothetical protein
MLSELDAQNGAYDAVQANVRAEAQSAIWRGDRDDPQGGLALRLRLDVSQSGVRFEDIFGSSPPSGVVIPVPYSAEVRADVTAGYRWVVKDGVLGVEPLRTKVTDNYGDTAVFIGVNGPVPREDGSLIDALNNDVPKELWSSAREQQLTEIPDILREEPVSCDSADDCAVGDAARALKTVLSWAADPEVLPTTLLSDSESRALKSAISSPTEWDCIVRAGAKTKTCNILARAKRVNAYPNGVELVFREGTERPITREFALESVAKTLVALGYSSRNSMCDAPTPGAKLQMNFVNKVQLATYD